MDKFLIRKEASGSRESDSEQSLNPTNSNVKKAKIRHYLNRQYTESYLKFGYFWSGDAAQPNPLCVVCGDKMSNESMVPSKLKRHLTSKHSSLQDKDLVYFQRLLDQQSKQRNVFEKTMTASERAQLASIEVAEIIALKSKSHILAESVILPACKKIVKSMFGEKAEKEISKIPLSNDTIHRRILDLSENIEKKVQKKLQDSTFALTVDESMDISNTSHLLAFKKKTQILFVLIAFYTEKFLFQKISQEDLKLVLHQLVEIVNYIKSRPLKSRLFEQLCKGMDSQHVRLLMHTEVRWLSKALDENIDHYFPSLSTEKYDWIRNPFMNIPSNIGLQLCEEEELATISSDRDLKIKHSTVPIDSFWISVQEEYPTLSKKA
ncbi:zinc finger BED domain-containing protein 5-like [Palaemon carinicauda]|uniref:zinc finger BED domain-containing protein 5-like n=1 Tax=Palaemon carinicauda TaxID=392227 RepID=UPI0035B5E4F4